jgi:microcin C transport system substrate-binding protein
MSCLLLRKTLVLLLIFLSPSASFATSDEGLPPAEAKGVMLGERFGPPMPHKANPQHALVLFGKPKYPKNFRQFAYVNPNAPKGGTVKLYSPNGFDSLNPYILKGIPAPGLQELFYESLMARALDEPQTYYPLVAESVDLYEDRSQAVFKIYAKAKWHDGTAITAEDVVWSLKTLKSKGSPPYQLLYKPIEAKVVDARTVHFFFEDPTNRELPFYAAAMPLFPRHYYEGRDFAKTSLEPPLGGGPYRIESLDPGRRIVFKRVENYWAKDLSSRKGIYNFDHVRYDVYRDETVALEAFKAHEYDEREEYIARNWATAYNFPAVREGRVKKYEATHKIPRGMQAFVFNLRHPKFQDRRVREAIGMTMDFEWMNRTLFYGAYDRNNSFFQNTDFSATKLPDANEMKFLEPYRDILPPETFTQIYAPPVSDGSGNIRPRLVEAQRLLNEAGWHIGPDGWRVNKETGETLTVEFMMSQTTFQRVIMPMIRNMRRLGIDARYRQVDEAQYQKRLEQKDFDIVSVWWNLGVLFPGNEQKSFWYSSQADVHGGQNLSGLKMPLVDLLLDKIASAYTLEELATASRALDRVLLWQHVIIPHWSISHFRTAYWDIFALPKDRPEYDLGFWTWWVKPEIVRQQKLRQQGGRP